MNQDNDPNGWSFYAGLFAGNYIYWPSLILGSLGSLNNSFVLLILFSQQQTPHLTILKSLALSDLGISLILLALIHTPIDFKVPNNFLGELCCRVYFSLFIPFALSATSAWHVVGLTLDIYGGQGNYKWHQFFYGSKLRTRLSICAFWILGFAIMSNNLWNYYVDPNTRTCFLTWKSNFLRYSVGSETILLIVILPLLVMICCYILLFKKVYDAKNFYKLRKDAIGSAENELFYNHKTANMFLFSVSFRTLLLLVVYSVSWMPTMTIWFSYVVKLSSIDIFDKWYSKTSEVLPFLNAAVNPILYGWSWFEFREAVRKKLTRKRHQKSEVTIN